MSVHLCFSLVFSLFQAVQSSTVYNITASRPLDQNQTLVSPSQIFELGFFTPNGPGKQYVGIWYKNMTPSKVVWVANRDKPLGDTDRSASLVIGGDGNLKLLDKQQNSVWSTNVMAKSNYSAAVLSDFGNLVLQDGSANEMWQSFDEPTDTLLPNMKIGVNAKTGKKLNLVSWKGKDDPSFGSFVLGITSETPPQGFVWNGSSPYWRSGPWDKSKFIGIPNMSSTYLNDYDLPQNIDQGTSYFNFNNYNNSFFGYFFISSEGSTKLDIWSDGWSTYWEAPAPTNHCDIYGTCGPFGVCDPFSSTMCRCLKGFKPRSDEEWNRGNWSGGCLRETELNCQKSQRAAASTTMRKDVFWQMKQMKLPDSTDYMSSVADEEGCQSWCLGNCSCLAFSFVDGIGCMVWSRDLLDIQQFSMEGEDLFIRLAAADTGAPTRTILIVSLSTLSLIMLFGAGISVCGPSRWRGKFRTMEVRKLLRSGDTANRSEESIAVRKEQMKQDDAPELVVYDLDSIILATDNFDAKNKLGQGGFGPVYKGKLNDGKEIAAKRLSSNSGQGIAEFKNEILLISKLQHRNLVRLFGCCTEGDENILVYEYLPNKSLDTFLFGLSHSLKNLFLLLTKPDSKEREKLSWGIRFGIVQGVARGLLYLHRDSCLRVIHRDLKLFSGYMSPEYAMGGIFSEKSDVYSFGVLMLEIISSKKNTSLDYPGQHLNLLTYAWHMWCEGRGFDLLDEAIANTFSPLEVMRCIQLGLLCAQDHAADRPNMSAVVLMLSGQSDLPQPKQPTITFHSSTTHEVQIQSQEEKMLSRNTITITMVEGR
ncbi:hypothetical protein BT93_B0580 [Corymbia citriodora subsp. variegata]|nr:hypothetical protein BT93_B0580 [Corymbia citriodora subsp. variegata]